MFIKTLSTVHFNMAEFDDYHYVSQLCYLWGRDTLDIFRLSVKRGDIDSSKVYNIARDPRVLAVNTYNDNIHLDLMERFERVLEYWVVQTLFNFKPHEAQELLVEVLTRARCSNLVIARIKSKMACEKVDQNSG